jgi:hypothetical protein
MTNIMTSNYYTTILEKDSPDVDSTELSYSELRDVVLHYGFEIRDEAERTCYYTQVSSTISHYPLSTTDLIDCDVQLDDMF